MCVCVCVCVCVFCVCIYIFTALNVMSFEELKIYEYIDYILLHLLIIIVDNTEINPSHMFRNF
jgi:hypothetical protein